MNESLEEEVLRLRRENENLLVAVEHLQKQAHNAVRTLERLRRSRTTPGTLGRWDATVRLCLDSHWGVEGTGWGLAVVQRRHKLLLPGDLVILVWANGGGERQYAWCQSARGYAVREMYLPYSRHKAWRTPGGTEHDSKQMSDRTLLKLVELPDVLAKKSPSDPAVRQFVAETLCAGNAAPG
jgi:hypothetical protein